MEGRAKEQSKLSAIEQARLEVETYENRLDVLLSVHKEQAETWDWATLAATLPPPCPQRSLYHQLKAKLRMLCLPPCQEGNSEAAVKQARLEDEQAFQQAMQVHSNEKAEREKVKGLARRILAGEHTAYTEALAEFSPLSEISDLGSSIQFTVHGPKLIECALKVRGTQAIPSQVKTLTASGKVSVKPMPRVRFHEIYQDYVCGCMLRVVREVFALLPVEVLLITAIVDSLDSRTGQTVEQPVLSAAMPRAIVARLDFDRLDPSDAVDSFLHRGDFKATRKSEAFQSITPLAPADIAQTSVDDMGLRDLLVHVQRLREELKTQIAELTPHPGEPTS